MPISTSSTSECACGKCGTQSFLTTPIVDGDILIQSVTARLNYRFGT